MVSLLVLPVVRVRVSLKLLQLPRALQSTNRELLQHAQIGIPLRIIDILFFGSAGAAPDLHFLFHQYALPTLSPSPPPPL